MLPSLCLLLSWHAPQRIRDAPLRMSAAEMRWPLRSRKHVEPATPESTLRLEAAKAAAAAFAPGTAAVPRRRRLERVERKRASKRRFAIRTTQAINTLMRVALPTIVASVLGLLYFDNVSLYIRSLLDVGAIGMLMADEAQFVQNFLTVIGLLFSILAGNAYSALYEQQEAIYFALFQEVSEAKSLLEQTTLVCQGRPFYQAALHYIRLYVKRDLRQLDVPPAPALRERERRETCLRPGPPPSGDGLGPREGGEGEGQRGGGYRAPAHALSLPAPGAAPLLQANGRPSRVDHVHHLGRRPVRRVRDGQEPAPGARLTHDTPPTRPRP